MTHPGHRWAVLAAAALLAGGCGLTEYEDRLREERARVKAIEEERKLTGDPLEMPKRPQEGLPPALTDANLYLRPPRVFGCKGGPEGPYGTEPKGGVPAIGSPYVAVYRYPGAEGFQVFVSCVMELMEPRDFQQEVWNALHDWSKRERKRPIYPGETSPQKTETKEPLRLSREKPRPLEFTLTVSDEVKGNAGVKDPVRFSFYYYHHDSVQLAIIYMIPLARAGDPAVVKGIDASLKSLALGAEALRRRRMQ